MMPPSDLHQDEAILYGGVHDGTTVPLLGHHVVCPCCDGTYEWVMDDNHIVWGEWHPDLT